MVFEALLTLFLQEAPPKTEFKFKLKVWRENNLKMFPHSIAWYFSAFDYNLQVTHWARKTQKQKQMVDGRKGSEK